MRIYSLNECYFEKIDTREKGCVLGFIYADGCVDQNNRRYSLSFGQQTRDREILEYIKECLGYSGPIRYDQLSKLNEQIYYCDRLKISSKKLIKDLNKHGVTPRKSLILEAPQIEQEFIGSFIRGYFDGDGHVGIYARKDCDSKHPGINFSGTLEVLTWIENNARGGNIYPDGNIYKLMYASKKSIMPLIELMNESPFGLSRKTKKLNEIVTFLENSEEREQIRNQKLARARTGEKGSNAKLTKIQVLQIRDELANSVYGDALAEKFEVAPSTISCIKTGRSWKENK